MASTGTLLLSTRLGGEGEAMGNSILLRADEGILVKIH
jgi:hypothetical protein